MYSVTLINSHLDDVFWNAWTASHRLEFIHEPFEILVQVFEDHVELLVGVHHVQQLDHVRMFQLLEE